MIYKISYHTEKAGYTEHLVGSYREAENILVTLFKRKITADVTDEKGFDIGGVWYGDEKWNWVLECRESNLILSDDEIERLSIRAARLMLGEFNRKIINVVRKKIPAIKAQIAEDSNEYLGVDQHKMIGPIVSGILGAMLENLDGFEIGTSLHEGLKAWEARNAKSNH